MLRYYKGWIEPIILIVFIVLFLFYVFPALFREWKYARKLEEEYLHFQGDAKVNRRRREEIDAERQQKRRLEEERKEQEEREKKEREKEPQLDVMRENSGAGSEKRQKYIPKSQKKRALKQSAESGIESKSENGSEVKQGE